VLLPTQLLLLLLLLLLLALGLLLVILLLLAPQFGKKEQWLFPTKAYHMLLDVEQRDEAHIVSFTPSGKAIGIAIHDADADTYAFIERVVRCYFNHTTVKLIKLFKRQFYLYGLTRIMEGDAFDAYTHPKFVRGCPDLLLYFDTCLPPNAKKACNKR
jgi:hypothetical protein